MSVAAANLDVLFAISTDAIQDGPPEAKAKMLDALRKNANGNPVPEDVLPSRLFAWRGPLDESRPLTKKLPHLSSCGGFMVVTSEAANVLRQFDLGGCKLHPVEVLLEDRATPFPGSYFLLDFDSWKDVFLPDQSPDFPEMRGAKDMWAPKTRTKEDVVVLSSAAKGGADLWWCPKIYEAFFLSDRLVQALRKAGVDKPFTLRRCRSV